MSKLKIWKNGSIKCKKCRIVSDIFCCCYSKQPLYKIKIENEKKPKLNKTLINILFLICSILMAGWLIWTLGGLK